MNMRHYTGFRLKDAITTTACAIALALVATLPLSACMDSDTPPLDPTQVADLTQMVDPTPLDSEQDTNLSDGDVPDLSDGDVPDENSFGSVIKTIHENLERATEQVREAVGPHSEDLQNLTKDEVEKLFRWEYRVKELSIALSAEQFQEELAKLGLEGWECVSFLPQGDKTRVTCKRRPRGALAYLKYIPGL